LTGRYLNIVNNSGNGGFYAANAVGRFGWYLFNCNFCHNGVEFGVLTSLSNGVGMSVDSCLFLGNAADIGLINFPDISPGGITLTRKFNLTNCVFSGEFPSPEIVSSTKCRSGSMTASWAIIARLCPTYSASASVSPLATLTRSSSFSPSRSASSSGHFFDSRSFSMSASIARSGILSQSLFGPSAADGSLHPSLQFNESFWFTFSTAALFGTSFIDKSRSSLSVGFIVGISIVVVVVILICVAIATVVYRRKSQSSNVSGQSDRLTLHFDIGNNDLGGTMDTTGTTFVDALTYGSTSEVPSSVYTGVEVDLTASMIG
jgi:hypothetical protein